MVWREAPENGAGARPWTVGIMSMRSTSNDPIGRLRCAFMMGLKKTDMGSFVDRCRSRRHFLCFVLKIINTFEVRFDAVFFLNDIYGLALNVAVAVKKGISGPRACQT